MITNIGFGNYTGTETFVRDLALELSKMGCYPMIYAPRIDGPATELINAAIPVVSDLSKLPRKPHVIHGHHLIQTMQVAIHFPKVPCLFVCHDRTAWHDIPPFLENIKVYVAVDLNCLERLLNEYQISINKTQVIHNWVDTNRFKWSHQLALTPRKALIFSNYAGTDTHLQPIQKACDEINLSLDVIGHGVNRGTSQPEKNITGYDIVFAKAKCAIESIATGAATILCDTRGLGGMVTTKNVIRFKDWNFGMKLLNQPITVDRILKEISTYNANDAKCVTEYVRKNCTLQQSVEKFLQLYKKILVN